MSVYRDALAVNSQVSGERLALAAEVLATRAGVVMLDGVIALRATHTRLFCEVVDAAPSTHRCAEEYAVLMENAQRALAASTLRDLLPDLPRKWLVIGDYGAGTVELWHAP